MRSLSLGFSLVMILSASIALAADAPSKSPDLQTIDGVTSIVTTTPIALPPLPAVTPAPSAAARAVVPATPEPGAAAKLEALWRLTSAPAAAPDPIELPNGKFADFSSSLGDAWTGEGPAPTRAVVLAPTGHPLVEVLGVPFEPATVAKPAEVITVGEPTGIDHSTPAVPAAKPAVPVQLEPDVASTRPRDPSLPPPNPSKDGATPEVRR